MWVRCCIKGVIKSTDLASCSLEEIKLYLKQQGVRDLRRIFVCKEIRIIDINAYILTFNKPAIPTCIKIGYINAKIENLIEILKTISRDNQGTHFNGPR